MKRALVSLARRVLPQRLRRGLLALYRKMLRPYRIVDGVRIPPPHLRYGEPEFKTDTMFLASAWEEVRRLAKRGVLSPESRVLDVGCGSGRFLFGLRREFGAIRQYTGMDIMPDPINWADKYLATGAENVRFVHLDVQNERYNPDGRPLDSAFQFPFDDASFDLVYVYGVFCHLLSDEILVYLREFHRILDDGGCVFLTGYVEPDVLAVTVNPENYIQEWTQKRHCVRYSNDHFAELISRAQLVVDDQIYRSEYDGQSTFFLRKSLPL